MRSKMVFVLALGLMAGSLALAAPAGAQATPGVTVISGIGNTCAAAGPPCVFDMNDPLWNKALNNPPSDGLYFPGVGPAGTGLSNFTAPSVLDPGGQGFCVSTQGGPGCTITATGHVNKGEIGGNGAYCGSSSGDAHGNFLGADGSTYTFDVTWTQSAATILPQTGTASTGQTVISLVSARGTGNGGNCGITQATTAFNVEGVSFAF